MASLIRRVGLLQIGRQPILQQTRNKGNDNLYKRKPKVKTLHFKRAELFSILKPIYQEVQKPMWETCRHVVATKSKDLELSQFETVKMREMMNRFKHAKLVVVLAATPISTINLRRAEVYFGRKQMTLIRYTKRVIKGGIEGTVYANLGPLFVQDTYFLFCAEQTVKELFQIARKYPEFAVLGGYMEGRLFSRTQLDEFAKLPSLEATRVKLLSTLNSAALQLVSKIETSQTMLVSHLDSRADELRKSQSSEKVADATEQCGSTEEASSAEVKDAKT